tara:strand:+ start:1858 stop:2181 length:324 start_codon:yes stop_codon:yes gene_type:complete
MTTPKWYPEGKVKYPKRAKPKKGVMLDPGQKKKATPLLYERARGGHKIPGQPAPKLKSYGPKQTQARAKMVAQYNSGMTNKPLFGFTKKYPPSVTGPKSIKGGRRSK